jgi:hypothetical protein
MRGVARENILVQARLLFRGCVTGADPEEAAREAARVAWRLARWADEEARTALGSPEWAEIFERGGYWLRVARQCERTADRLRGERLWRESREAEEYMRRLREEDD